MSTVKLNINEFTICLHCGCDQKIVDYQMESLKPLEKLYKIHWNNRIDRHPGAYDSYSELVNEAVVTSPTEFVILINDRAHPKPHEVMHILYLLENGYAAATKWSVAFMGLSKELFRKIGFWDERYFGGGYEDDEFVIKLRLNDLAYYESEEAQYDMNWQTQLRPSGGEKCARSQPHFMNKWRHTSTELRQVIPDEVYTKYDLGAARPDISSTWQPWSYSRIGIMYAERMITHGGGPTRTYHFRAPNGYEYRTVASDFLQK